MSGTGSVERILVGGILVVVLAILGIASWSATGGDEDSSPAVATDGGVTDGGTSSLANGARPAGADKLEEARRRNAEALRRRQELTARLTDAEAAGGEREALAKDRPADGPRRVGPPETLDTASPVEEGVPLRSNGKPHTADPSAVSPLQPGTLPKPVPGALVDSAPKRTAPRPAAAQPAVHTVEEGDTLWGIVKRHYGEGDVQGVIDIVLQANPTVDADTILVGQVLTLPVLGGNAAALVTPTPEELVEADDSVSLYEVREGDTLSDIAAAELGSSGRWVEIYELNRRRLPSPDRVLPGMTLVMPKR